MSSATHGLRSRPPVDPTAAAADLPLALWCWSMVLGQRRLQPDAGADGEGAADPAAKVGNGRGHAGQQVVLQLTIQDVHDLHADLIKHKNAAREVALSGGAPMRARGSYPTTA